MWLLWIVQYIFERSRNNDGLLVRGGRSEIPILDYLFCDRIRVVV